MDACRRVAAVLLLLLWAVVGVSLPASSSVAGREAAATSTVGATSWQRPEGETKRERQTAVDKALGADDDDGLPPWLDGPSARPGVDSATWACLAAERRPSERSPLSGKPRGPPSLA